MAAMAEAAGAGEANALSRQSFGAWMADEQPRILLLCLRMLRDPQDAGAAAQDVFWKAYQAIERQDDGTVSDPARWLTRIAVNTCLDRLRSRRWQFWRRRPAPADEVAILAFTPCSAPTPEQQAMAREIARRLHAALGRLSDRQRAVFVLKHYEDRTLAEIAELLRLDLGTVKVHLARAISRLRVELKDLYGTHTLDRG